jgi:UDP-3-O-[3-hydroxymyristoyl] glucosamine N-acyltransferase
MAQPTATAPIPPLTLSEIAARVDGRVVGDTTFRSSGLRPVDEAGPTDLAFVASRKYLRLARTSTAGAFLVAEELADLLPDDRPRVVVPAPHQALHAILQHFHPPVPHVAEIHPTAVLGEGVELGKGVSIGPYAVLEPGVTVGAGTRIDAHVVLGRDTEVGPDCHIYPQVVVYPGTSLGARVVVHAGARLGSDGFGYTFADGAHRKIPQVGRCIIGDDVEIGANTTIDRGSLGDTVIGTGVKIDNLVQIAHNVKVGALSLMAALVGIAGSTRIGKGTWFGGQVGVIGHLEVGDGARLAVAAKVQRDVRPGETMSGNPARPHREELRRQAQLGRLHRLMSRVDALEEAVGVAGGSPSNGEGVVEEAPEVMEAPDVVDEE